MNRALTVAVLAVAALAIDRPDAHAQSTARWSVAGGLVWTGSYPIGDATADLLQNASGNPPPAFPLFRAKSSFESTPGIDGRVGFAITPRLMIEVGGGYSKPQVRVEISEDREGDATSFDGETIVQYTVDVSAIWELPFRPTARIRPFVIGGGSYLRQLHDERTVLETGQLYHVGAGARVFLRGATAGHPFGVRADVQATFRRSGIDFENQRRAMPTVSALAFFGF